MAGQRGKMAERRALPERTMLAVEYPGYVVDTAKALRSLGGSKKLARDTTEDVGMPVELRFRYEDPASHPINGEITPTENLLLKVTRRVRRRRPPQTGDGPAPAEEEEAQVRAEVVAVLDRTVRFRKLADFQYIVPRTDAIAQFARLTNGIDIDIDAVKQLGASSLLDEAPGGAVGYVPAPFLDRRGWPSQYQHAAAGGSGADGAQASDAHQRRRREGGKPTFHGIYMKFDAESVPERPSAAAERECRGVPARALQKAQRILDEFPVINRAAVEALLPPAECGGHRQTTIMPLLAYLMDTGPWRNCWIRLGYDPRKDPGSCKYQILDIRNANTGVSVGRVRMNPRSTLAQTQPDDAPPAAATARTRGHVFDDEAVRQKAAGIFQFMHVEVQPLRELIDYMPGRRQTPCEYSGWLQPSVMRTMRLKLRAIKRLSGAAAQGSAELAVDYAELDAMISADRREEAEARAAEQLIEVRGASAAGGPLAQAVREHVDARVDEFMRALGTEAASDQPMDEPDSDAAAGEFDIFGYDDASD